MDVLSVYEKGHFTLLLFFVKGLSLIYIENIKGPRIASCGTTVYTLPSRDQVVF